MCDFYSVSTTYKNDWSSFCRMKSVSLSDHYGMESAQKKKQNLYLGCLTKKQLVMISVAVGLVVLLIIIIVPAVVITKKGMFSKMWATYNSLNCSQFCPLQGLHVWDCLCLYCDVKSFIHPFHRSYSCLRPLAWNETGQTTFSQLTQCTFKCWCKWNAVPSLDARIV